MVGARTGRPPRRLRNRHHAIDRQYRKYETPDWLNDISLARTAHIDALLLNIASNESTNARRLAVGFSNAEISNCRSCMLGTGLKPTYGNGTLPDGDFPRDMGFNT